MFKKLVAHFFQAQAPAPAKKSGMKSKSSTKKSRAGLYANGLNSFDTTGYSKKVMNMVQPGSSNMRVRAPLKGFNS
jgi:hypothetical protein